MFKSQDSENENGHDELDSKSPGLEIIPEDTVAENPGELKPLVWEVWAVGEYKPFTAQFINQLEVGDEVWIKKTQKGYSHVALYIGNGEIIHVSDVKKTLKLGTTIVSRDNLFTIAENTMVGLRHTEASPKKARQILARAEADVGKILPYSLTTVNCEHQVRYWISGKANYNWFASTQIKDYLVLAGIFGLLGGLAGWLITFYAISQTIVGRIIGFLIGFLIGSITISGLKFCLTRFEHSEKLPWNRRRDDENI